MLGPYTGGERPGPEKYTRTSYGLSVRLEIDDEQLPGCQNCRKTDCTCQTDSELLHADMI